MYAHNIALAIAPLLFLASADVQLDNDDVPNACKDICQPIVTLTQRCEVDLRGDDNDRDENRLEAQCVCTNDSFDVASIAALCHDCMRQNIRSDNNNNDDDDDDDDDDNDNDWDDSDLEEIREILYTCGWSTTSYASASSTAANGITVEATAPTAISQLTTTIVPGSTNTANANSGSSSGSGSGSGSGSNTDTASASASASDSSATASDDSASTTTDSASQASETDNAAPGLAPIGVAGLAVLGAFVMLA